MISAVLLELEGVIADTRDARRQALLDSVGEKGISLTDAEYLEHCAAVPVRAAVRAAFALRNASRSAPLDDTGVELAALRAERRFASLMETGLTLAHGARELDRRFDLPGALTATAGITLLELTAQQASLEEAFVDMTRDAVEFRAPTTGGGQE